MKGKRPTSPKREELPKPRLVHCIYRCHHPLHLSAAAAETARDLLCMPDSINVSARQKQEYLH